MGVADAGEKDGGLSPPVKRLTEVCELLVRSLVDVEAEVKVVTNAVDTLVLFHVHVAKNDFGKLLGRKGANAKSLRLFIRAIGRKHGLDAYVKVIDSQGNEFRIPDPEVEETDPGHPRNAPKTAR